MILQYCFCFSFVSKQVVLSHATHLYFDHPYEPNPEERGYYWATRFTDTRKTFGYIPDDIFYNADKSRDGHLLTKDQICPNNECLKLEKPENIIGMVNCCMYMLRTGQSELLLLKHGFKKIISPLHSACS